MYWRLLSSDPATAKQIVMGEKPTITAESEKLDPATLEEMCLNIGTLATVYLKPVHQVFRSARPRRLIDSLPIHPSTNGNDDLAAAVDAADVYFSGLASHQMAAMDIGDEGFGASPALGAPGERQYVVSQSHPQQVYQPQVGSGNGDLLM